LGKTLNELLITISSKELTEWEAFFALEKEDHEKEMRKNKKR